MCLQLPLSWCSGFLCHSTKWYLRIEQLHVHRFESNWPVVQPVSARFGTYCSLLQTAMCWMLWTAIWVASVRYGYLDSHYHLFFLVIIFQFHVTSAEMNAFVFLCQFMMFKYTGKFLYVHYTTNLRAIHFFVLAITSFYGTWNLDFFRYFIPPTCISRDLYYASHNSTGIYCCHLSTFVDNSYLSLYWDAWQRS